MKIAIIEDNEKIRMELASFLKKYNYETVLIDTFETVVDDVLLAEPHLILLDINLPVYDGYYICREIRNRSEVPIIIVTSRDTEMDELMSMNLGADDFVTKPYNTQILLARIATLLKRTYRQSQSDSLEHRGLTFSPSKSTISFGGTELELSKNETRILLLLMQNNERIVTRDEIMDALWQSDEFVDDNTLTVNVNRLRKRLEELGARDFIKTKRGIGYRLCS